MALRMYDCMATTWCDASVLFQSHILYRLLLAKIAILYSESLNYYKAARVISHTNVKLHKAPPPVSSFNIPRSLMFHI